MARRNRQKDRVYTGSIAGCECLVAAAVLPAGQTELTEEIQDMYDKGYVVNSYHTGPAQVRSCQHAKVYVVEGEQGEYSDYQHWTEAVYWNVKEAKEHAERITTRYVEGHFTVYGVLGNG